MQSMYGVFGFTFELQLSTRPEKYLGEIETWDKAEKQLAQSLDTFGHPWTINEADGAFYGPKIDIKLYDALKRKHQCATIQLDFQLPERFDLTYEAKIDDDDEDKKEGLKSVYKRPVIVHRAILGSVERMIAVLIEHTAGKWPFWLSPRQCRVVPITQSNIEYGEKVAQILHDAGYYAECETSRKQFKKKYVKHN